MKLLIVTPLYEPAWERGGGVLTCLVTLSRALAQKVAVAVYTTDASGMATSLDVPLEMPVDRNGVTVQYFRSTFGPKSTFDSRPLSRHLRRTIKDYDLVYIVALWQWIGISAAHICMSAGVPFVIGTHGGFSRRLRAKSYLAKWFFRKVLWRSPLRAAAAIHLTCAAERTDADTWLEGLNCMIVPNAVDPAQHYRIPASRASFRRKHGIPDDAPVVLSVGRPDWKKHIELLIDALREEAGWFLVFAGDDRSGKGPEWKAYAAKAGVADRVVWTGFLSGDELRAAFSAADLFALVSENENFGMVVAEAMMCGLPVLLSREVGICEYLRDQSFALACDLSSAAVAAQLEVTERRLSDFRVRREEIRQYAIDRFASDCVAGCFLGEVRRVLADPLSVPPSAGEACRRPSRSGEARR